MSGAPGQDLRDRAAQGAVVVGARNLAVRVLGLLGMVVLARLLAPEDFGVLAFGLALTVLGRVLATGGLGAGLIRREEPPSVTELRVVLGYQLLTTGAFAALLLGIGSLTGGAGLVAGIMALGLPVTAARSATAIVLDRRLGYGPLARAEVLETLAYNVLAIGSVLLGAGVWGVAGATVAGSLAGTADLLARHPEGRLRPALSYEVVRPLLGFGIGFQAVTIVGAVRDQGLNIVLGATAGAAVLGVWSVTSRLLQAVLMLLQALWRVSLSAMARLLEAGERPQPLLERSLSTTSVAIGILVVALAGPAPALVPTLFGPGWDGVAEALPIGAAALMLSGPISTSITGFLFAKGDARAVFRTVSWQALTWLVVAAALAPFLGATGAAIGMLLAACTVARSLALAVRRHVRLHVWRPVRTALAAAAAASCGAWWVADTLERTPLAAVMSILAAEALFLGAMAVARGSDVERLFRLLGTAVRRALPRGFTPAGGRA